MDTMKGGEEDEMAKAKGQYGVRRYRPNEIFLEKKENKAIS